MQENKEVIKILLDIVRTLATACVVTDLQTSCKNIVDLLWQADIRMFSQYSFPVLATSVEQVVIGNNTFTTSYRNKLFVTSCYELAITTCCESVGLSNLVIR
jgi:hypothetical protein